MECRYRKRLAALSARLAALNAGLGFAALSVEEPQGGWYVPLRVSPRLMPGVSNGVDAFAVLLHYGGMKRDSGVGLLPGELFGHRAREEGFLLRATVAVSDAGTPDLHRPAGGRGHAAHRAGRSAGHRGRRAPGARGR